MKILFYFLLSFLFYPAELTAQLMTIHHIDVGQGDALFIESPTGTQIMFDGGPARKVLGSLARVM